MKKQLVVVGTLALLAAGIVWLVIRPSSSAHSSPGTAPAAQQATHCPAATSVQDSTPAMVTVAPETPATPPRAELSAAVDPAQAAEIKHALATLQALYQPAGSLNWDQAKALIAKRDQATRELVDRLGQLGAGGARAMAAAISEANSLRAKLVLVQAMGKVNDPEAAGLLQSLLASEASFSLRKEAAVALGQRRDSASEQVLAASLAHESDAQLRVAAAQGLAGRESALPVMAERLRDESDQDVRLELIRSIGLIAKPSAMSVLADVAQGQGAVLARKAAIQELSRSFGADAFPVLSRLLNDQDEAIRKSAVGALARTKNTDAVASLQQPIANSQYSQ